MSDDKEREKFDLSDELSKLVAKASEKKILKKEAKIVKKADLSKVPETRKQVLQMQKDGFSTEQIAAALGFPQEQIAFFLEDEVELGTPEQILQESLKTLVSLIPVADAVYRNTPNFHNSLALTGIIDSSKNILQELCHLQDKEEAFRAIVVKVIQPMLRGMISDLMVEFRFYTKTFDVNPQKEQLSADLQSTAINVGKKFEEAYRRANEQLAVVMGLNPDAKARVMASLSLNDDED